MNKVNNIIIFVGGKGTRLGNITKKIPKPLIKINGLEFLEYQLHHLIKLKPKKIILLCGYKKLFFEKKYHNKYIRNTKIICVEEHKLLGTGGSLENSKRFITNNTLLCNGDTYFNYDFTKITKIKFKEILLLLVKNKNYKSNSKLSNLKLLKDKTVEYNQKSNLMNSGYYLISKDFKKYLKKGINSLENDIIKLLIHKKTIKGKIVSGEHIDIGTKKNLRYFNKISKNIKFY